VSSKPLAISRVPPFAVARLSGWGANSRVDCRLSEPETPAQVRAWLDRSGTIPRGLGRSYGDASVNAGRQVLGMVRLDAYGTFDETTGTLT
jgi:decaprenylphospho-beta-D-ribofuranose 2-oxidase